MNHGTVLVCVQLYIDNLAGEWLLFSLKEYFKEIVVDILWQSENCNLVFFFCLKRNECINLLPCVNALLNMLLYIR